MTEYIKKEDVLKIIKRISGDYTAAFAKVSRLPVVDVDHVMGAVEYLRATRRLCDSHLSCTYCEFSGADWKLCPVKRWRKALTLKNRLNLLNPGPTCTPNPIEKPGYRILLKNFRQPA